MEEWILFVEGAGGTRDFFVLLQIPKSKHAKDMAEAAISGGLRAIFAGKIDVWRVIRQKLSEKRAHFHIEAEGPKLSFFCYLQTPKGIEEENQAQGLAEAIVEEGLVSYLSIWQKKITARRISETLPGQLERLGAQIKIA